MKYLCYQEGGGNESASWSWLAWINAIVSRGNPGDDSHFERKD